MHFGAILLVILSIAAVPSMPEVASTNLVGAPVKARARVSIFFSQGAAMRTEELESKAKAALAAKGARVSAACACAINISISGRKPGVFVIFQDFRQRMIYQVEFDEQGQVSGTFAGKQHEGVPPYGVPPPARGAH